MAGNRQEYDKIYTMVETVAVCLILLNIYHFAHPLFAAMGMSHEIVRNVLLSLRAGGLLMYPWVTKAAAALLLAMALLVRTGKGRDTSWWSIGLTGAAGTALYCLFPDHALLYILTTVAGTALMSWSLAMTGRRLAAFKQDVNDDNETFEQNTELIETEDSITIPYRFQWLKKMWNGFICVVNPFRASIVLGTPGSGKSFSIYNAFIKQMIHKGYTMFLYDYKFPDLTETVYNEYLRRYSHCRPGEKVPEFLMINFKDARYSNRCNPINPIYITDPADTTEIAELVMLNVNKAAVEKEDFFSMSAKVYLDCIIYFLYIYENGRYCTFPHAIELMAQDHKKTFAIMSGFPELETKLKPFVAALESNSMDQLMGQVASAQIPLGKFVSPLLYWVLSGDDFRLDINNPEHPKILCVGNDPDRQSIYGTTLALFTSRMFKLINHKGKIKCGVLLDELPTIFIKGLDNLIATARSNKVAIVLGAQDKTQLIRDYTEKEAKVIFNTVGNIFAGQVNGETAKDLSNTFGKEKRLQQSQTQNIDSESLSISYHDEELLPVRRIETLTQGYFFGKVADNNKTPIRKKLFCGEVQIDPKYFPGPQTEKIPMLTDFGEEEMRREVERDADNVIRLHFERIAARRHPDADADEAAQIAREMMREMKEDDRRKILSQEQETRMKDKVKRIIDANYRKIREDVQMIIDKELGEVIETPVPPPPPMRRTVGFTEEDYISPEDAA